MENMAPPANSMATLAALSPRERKTRNGTSGAGAILVSMTRNAARLAPEIASGMTVAGADHACVLVPATAYTKATSPPVTAIAPGMSSDGRSPSARVSTRTTRAATSAAAAMGMLM
jgi:hypothetical protein